ncbi:MAG TPA: dephospho-CoA kinase, partial [Kineosporiaceae bacterium]|nr:dephospho-CoA kinase [Kineosporiaceae bacterium]
GLDAVVEAFGPGVLRPDGSLDRPALGRLVFADEQARLRLNGILHPRIALRTGELIAGAGADAIVVHDVPLLVENRMGAGYHLVLVVHAGVEERVRRLVVERGMTEGEARSRIAAQADDAARRAAADIWLDNSEARDEVLTAVDRLWTDRLVPFEANVREHRPAPRPEPVSVTGPDPAWPRQATRLAARIRAVVGSAALRIDHTGSTAVPGLAARDVIDLQLVVADLTVADAVRADLEDAGFVRLPGERWDTAPEGGALAERVHTACDPGRAANLHLRGADGPAWRWQLMFRDWLRAQDGERDAYAAVKQGSAGVGIEAYQAAKGPWLTQALRRATAWATSTGWQPSEPGGTAG